MSQQADTFAGALNPNTAPAHPTKAGKNQFLPAGMDKTFPHSSFYFELCTMWQLVVGLNIKEEQS